MRIIRFIVGRQASPEVEGIESRAQVAVFMPINSVVRSVRRTGKGSDWLEEESWVQGQGGRKWKWPVGCKLCQF